MSASKELFRRGELHLRIKQYSKQNGCSGHNTARGYNTAIMLFIAVWGISEILSEQRSYEFIPGLVGRISPVNIHCTYTRCLKSLKLNQYWFYRIAMWWKTSLLLALLSLHVIYYINCGIWIITSLYKRRCPLGLSFISRSMWYIQLQTWNQYNHSHLYALKIELHPIK